MPRSIKVSGIVSAFYGLGIYPLNPEPICVVTLGHSASYITSVMWPSPSIVTKSLQDDMVVPKSQQKVFPVLKVVDPFQSYF